MHHLSWCFIAKTSSVSTLCTKCQALVRYAYALTQCSNINNAKLKYVYGVYVDVLKAMTYSYERLYQKVAFRLKNILTDSGYELFNSLSCDKMIQTIKETSLLNPNSLLSQFGITELY